MGDKSHQKECNDNANKRENFDATHSDVKERQDEGMCRVDIFEVIKYSIGDNEEFMGIHTLERHSWAQTVNGISSIYLDIFRKKDEGWTVHRTSRSHKEEKGTIRRILGFEIRPIDPCTVELAETMIWYMLKKTSVELIRAF
ncbi:hypothetical protein Tco_1316170 [Tanacetum coccineum]